MTPFSFLSDHGGQLVYEIVNGVDHELDVILLRHAVQAVSPEDDIYIGTEDSFGNLHGDMPGDVFIFQPMNEPHWAGDRDGALKHTVIFSLLQEVHAEFVKTLF